MEEIYHIPAMLKETIEGLAIKPDGVYVDVTFGGGGHSRAILENLSPVLPTREGGRMASGVMDDEKNGGEEAQGRVDGIKEEPERAEGDGAGGGHLYSFDQDIEAFENVQKDEREKGTHSNVSFRDNPRWTFVHSNFRYLKNWMDYYGVEQIDGLLADLGVSFHHFDCPERGFSFRYSAPLDMRMNQTAKRTAADIVNSYSEDELARLFWL